jgi:hypothetical protein
MHRKYNTYAYDGKTYLSKRQRFRVRVLLRKRHFITRVFARGRRTPVDDDELDAQMCAAVVTISSRRLRDKDTFVTLGRFKQISAVRLRRPRLEWVVWRVGSDCRVYLQRCTFDREICVRSVQRPQMNIVRALVSPTAKHKKEHE